MTNEKMVDTRKTQRQLAPAVTMYPLTIGPMQGPTMGPSEKTAMPRMRYLIEKRLAIMAGELVSELDEKAPAKIRNTIMAPIFGASIQPTLKHTKPAKLTINTIRRPYISDRGAHTKGAKQKPATYMKIAALVTLMVVLNSSVI